MTHRPEDDTPDTGGAGAPGPGSGRSRLDALRDAARPVAHHAGGRLKRHVRKVWASRGGGFYGFVAAATFLYLEAVDLVGDIAGLGPGVFDIGWLIGFLVNNLVEAILFMVQSVIWPVAWISRFGIGLTSGLLLGGAYLVYRAIHPTVQQLLEE